MNFFSGNNNSGSWKWLDRKGVWHISTPAEIRSDPAVLWCYCEGTGDFYWPHIIVEPGGAPQPMDYDDSET